MRKAKRSTADARWDIQIGAALAFIRRRDARQSQTIFAKRLGISRGHLANVESGRTPLTARLGWKFCHEFDCHPQWILLAGNSSIPNVFPQPSTHKNFEMVERIMNSSSTALFRDVVPPLYSLLASDYEIEEKKTIDNISESDNFERVKPQLQNLLERLKSATKERGKKSELAKFLGVKLVQVSQWLSGDREPGGETTLQLLQWVEAQERQK